MSTYTTGAVRGGPAFPSTGYFEKSEINSMPLQKKSTRNAARQRESDRKRSLQESKERKKKWKKVVFKIPKVNSKKKVEEGLKRKRDGARFAREKLKENPIKYQEYLQAERDRYQNDVLTGKRKKRSELSERELTLVRRKDRERKRKERAKKKEVVDNVDPEAPSSSTDTTTEPIRKPRYKANKRQRTCYNENRKYRQKNQVLTQKLDSTRKQLERLKNKKYPKSLNTGSPKSKTDAFLSKNPSLDAIRRELIFGEALKQDIRSRYKTTKKNAEKQYLTNLTRGKIIKKYRLMSEVKNNVTPALQIRFRDEPDYMSFKKKQKSHVENTKTSIEKFFVENSTIDPGKRAFKKVNGEKVQKRYLNASMVDLHKRFLTQGTLTVNYSTFTKYRPRYCVEPNVTDRDTCACHVHENFSLLVESLHKNGMIQENSPDKILSKLLCEHRTDECFKRECVVCKHNDIQVETSHVEDGVFNYYQWITEKEDRISAKTKKGIEVQLTKKVMMTSRMSNVVHLFNETLKNFIAHEYRIFHQHNFWKNLKNGITLAVLLFILDFSQNWLCKCLTEVHSFHFGASRQQFSLHTGMAYSGLFNEGFTTISECLRHDAVAIMTHLKPILDHYLAKLPNVTELHVLSDGPTTQYKNRFAVYVITQFLLNLFPQIARFTWNFSEAGHGKGPADGIGAAVKRAADDQVKYGADILDLSSLMTALEGKVPNVHITTVSNSDITLLESKVDCDLAKSFNGITKVHQYTWSKEHPKRVFLNTLSCSACAPGTRCEHFCIEQLNYDEVQNPARKRKSKLDHTSKVACKKVRMKVQKKIHKDVSKVRKRKGDRCDDSDSIVVKKSKKVHLNQKPSTASLALTSNLRRTSR
ncbi:hypothetical protein QAD02_012069 [Eretmocerus hayati]|uniref:Uncharacterized protein n=1 Tax=Eretmocerus hayati TaxID=131215 RepID=A0ACC2NYU9_9HYME|nr:hypothetical protein QAD02_012069 [Eretmocerus hayati]